MIYVTAGLLTVDCCHYLPIIF